jgi:hypothetical protein
MLNVVEFRKREPHRGSMPQHLPADAVADVSELASRIVDMQSKAKGDICNAIVMLDVSAKHSRQLAKKVSDPTMKKTFELHISMIEELLQLAQELALKL